MVPTLSELRVLQPLVRPAGNISPWRIQRCGFGPIAAAARTAQLIAATEPTEVLLVGIAGSLTPTASSTSPEIRAAPEIGTACRFDSVGCYGVGAGSGPDHQTAAELGWAHWEGASEDGLPEEDVSTEANSEGAPSRLYGSTAFDGSRSMDASSIGDLLPLASHASDGPAAGQLLTCCSASSSTADVKRRSEVFPAAVAEDMEGFGVAVSCRLAGVPLTIVRGISNRAGDREKRRWAIPEALAAAAELTLKILSQR